MAGCDHRRDVVQQRVLGGAATRSFPTCISVLVRHGTLPLLLLWGWRQAEAPLGCSSELEPPWLMPSVMGPWGLVPSWGTRNTGCGLRAALASAAV